MENKELIEIIKKIIDEKKGFEIDCIEIGTLTSIADYFIIAEGTSERHLKTIAEDIILKIKKNGIPPISVEGLNDGSGWILVDFGSIVVHLFIEEKRRKIKLEEFWKSEIKKIKK